jgi:hypothetical protein
MSLVRTIAPSTMEAPSKKMRSFFAKEKCKRFLHLHSMLELTLFDETAIFWYTTFWELLSKDNFLVF